MAPKRIISTVPSQTELLFDLGLDAEVVGITRFCIHPADKVKQKTLVGGTKALNLNVIHALSPDFILANKEENTKEQIETLQQRYAVHVTDVNTLPDALAMIREVGTLVGKRTEAEALANRIETSLTPFSHAPGLSVAYLIWRKPYMVAASDTFIHAMLEQAGFQNAFAGQTRYPVVSVGGAENGSARPYFSVVGAVSIRAKTRSRITGHLPVGADTAGGWRSIFVVRQSVVAGFGLFQELA